MSSPQQEQRNASGLAIVHRLLEMVYASYSPNQLRNIANLPHHEVQARFHLIAKMFDGPITNAPGYSIEQSPIGLAWLICPNGLAILYNPIIAGEEDFEVLSNITAYQDLAMAIALQATRPILGPIR